MTRSFATDREFPHCWDCDSELLKSGECPTCDFRDDSDDPRLMIAASVSDAHMYTDADSVRLSSDADLDHEGYAASMYDAAEHSKLDAASLLLVRTPTADPGVLRDTARLLAITHSFRSYTALVVAPGAFPHSVVSAYVDYLRNVNRNLEV